MLVFNKIVLWLLIILTLLIVIGLLNFGHGLGDILYYPIIIFLAIGHILITRFLVKAKKNQFLLPLAIIILVFCFVIIYKATIGRGPEFPWNGEIFFIK